MLAEMIEDTTKPVVIILAGGNGSRLQPWVAPKCLMPINGIPILGRLLSQLENHGIENVILCTGYRSRDIHEFILQRRTRLLRVAFSDAGENVAMGARLLKARGLIDEKRQVIVCYGDELATVDISELLNAHQEYDMTFCGAKAKIPGGTIHFHNGRSIARIIEAEQHYINIGFVVAEQNCWKDLDADAGLSEWVNKCIQNKKVKIFEHLGARATINTLNDLAYAESLFV